MMAVAAVLAIGLITQLSSRPTGGSHPVEVKQGWPDESNTGVQGCPALTPMNGPEIVIDEDGTVFENKEITDAVIRVLAHKVTIRCVKIIGTGFYGIDNTDTPEVANSATDVTVEKVEIDCQNRGVGLLLRDASIRQADVRNCDNMITVGGSNVTVEDSFCHDLSKVEGKDIHADCIQNLGGNNNLIIRRNALWAWDTSAVLLGKENGEASDVVVDGNRLMSDPDQSPPPAFLIYMSGTNTKVTNNRFTRRYTYGPCTLITAAENITWTGNVWDDDGAPVSLSDCK